MFLEESVEALEEHTLQVRRTGSTKPPPGANLSGCTWASFSDLSFLGCLRLLINSSFSFAPWGGESLLFCTHTTLGALFTPFLEHTLQGCTSEWSTGLREGKSWAKYWKCRVAFGQISQAHTFVTSFFSPLNLMLLLLIITNLTSTSFSPKEQFFSGFKDNTTCVDLVTAEPKPTISSENLELQTSLISSFQFHSKAGSASAALSWHSANTPHPKTRAISSPPQTACKHSQNSFNFRSVTTPSGL